MASILVALRSPLSDVGAWPDRAECRSSGARVSTASSDTAPLVTFATELSLTASPPAASSPMLRRPQHLEAPRLFLALLAWRGEQGGDLQHAGAAVAFLGGGELGDQRLDRIAAKDLAVFAADARSDAGIAASRL